MIDPTVIGNTAAELMEEVEEIFGEDAEILDCVVAIEVGLPNESTTIMYKSSTPRLTISAGIATFVAHGITAGFTPDYSDDFDDFTDEDDES